MKVQVWEDNLLQSPNKIDFMMSSPPLSISAAASVTDAKWTNVTVQNRTTSVSRVTLLLSAIKLFDDESQDTI